MAEGIKRLLVVVAAAGLACDAAPAAPPPARVVLSAPPRAAARALDPIPDDPAGAYVLGFEWWRDGRTEDALRAFHAVIAALVRQKPAHKHQSPPHPEPGVASEMAREGEHVALVTHDGVLVSNAQTGALERLVPLKAPYAIAALGDGLIAVSATDEIALLDPSAGAIAARVARAESVFRGKKYFGFVGTLDAGPFVDLWDAPHRKQLHTLQAPSLQTVMRVDFSEDERDVVACGNRCVVWDVASGAEVLACDSVPGVTGPPAFSADGRLIAYGTVNMDVSPLVGTTFLFDTALHKVIAQSHASRMPTGFAFADKWLAVGDLRRTCLLGLPRMNLVACSGEVRPSAGMDDDLQDAHPSFVGTGALAIETSDGSILIVRVPSMATAWKGRGRLATAPDGTRYLVDVDNHELYSVGPAGNVTHVRALGELENEENIPETHQHAVADQAAFDCVSKNACHVGEWIFPAIACAGLRSWQTGAVQR